MAMWKHYIVLFGGFYDPGIKSEDRKRVVIDVVAYIPHLPANYLNDLWLFDTQEYKWRQIEFKDNDRKPSYAFH